MGPELAIVGAPGSPSDVLRTKVHISRPLDGRVRITVRLRSVIIYWLTNQRQYSHIWKSIRGYSFLPRASARGARELSLVAKWHCDGYLIFELDPLGATPTWVCDDAGRRGFRSPLGARGASVGIFAG